MLGDPCIEITSAKVVGPFLVDLTFNDGSRKRVNLRPLLKGPIFEPLHDPAEFARLKLRRSWGTIVWPNGADMAPEALHSLPDDAAPAGAVTRRTRTRSRSRAPGRGRRAR